MDARLPPQRSTSTTGVDAAPPALRVRRYRRRLAASLGLKPPLLVLHHIPKTAGTALRGWLRTAFGRDRVFWQGESEDGDLGAVVARAGAQALDGYTVIGGHLTVGDPYLAGLPRRCIHAAVVRAPSAQIPSHFAYVAARPDHPLHEGGDLTRALTCPGRFYAESIVLQCQYLGGAPTAEAALASVRNRPFVLGCLDRLDLFVETLAALYDVEPGPLRPANVGPEGYASRLVTPAAQAVIDEISQEDQHLHAYVRARGLVLNRV